MNVKICDICGKHIGPDAKAEIREYRLLRYKDNHNCVLPRSRIYYSEPLTDLGSATEEPMDICSECYTKLKTFIKEGINHGN